MSKDMQHTYVHFHKQSHADLFDDFCKEKIAPDDIFVPQQNQPLNPEDEDDVVPDQHAAFGIQRATQNKREPAWKDLRLTELMEMRYQGPGGLPATDGSRLLGRKTMPR